MYPTTHHPQVTSILRLIELLQGVSRITNEAMLFEETRSTH